MNFSFPHHETTKLGPQQITVESCDASYSPRLAVFSIHQGHYLLLAAVPCCLRSLLAVNFSFLHHETTKLGPQQITVESCDASYSPRLEVLSIHQGHHILLAAVSCSLRSTTSRDNKVRSATNHGRKLQCKLLTSLSGIVHSSRSPRPPGSSVLLKVPITLEALSCSCSIASPKVAYRQCLQLHFRYRMGFGPSMFNDLTEFEPVLIFQAYYSSKKLSKLSWRNFKAVFGNFTANYLKVCREFRGKNETLNKNVSRLLDCPSPCWTLRQASYSLSLKGQTVICSYQPIVGYIPQNIRGL